MEGTLSGFGNALLLSFVLGFLITLKMISLGCSYKSLWDLVIRNNNLQIQTYHLN